MIGVGVIGYGYWGPNLVRNFHEAPGARVMCVCDMDEDRVAAAAARFPGVRMVRDFQALLDDPSVDAVVIATPVSTHYALGMEAIRKGKHVLVEKPLTDSVETSLALEAEANARGVVLMVDHTFVYTGAVRKLAELVRSGEMGKLYYYDSTRVNLGLFQRDVNVLWDLAVHDLAIMDFVLGQSPLRVSATGMAHISGRQEDIAWLTCEFPDRLVAHFNVNWLSPVKVRRTLLSGDKKMAVYDDLEPSEKVRLYDSGITLGLDREGSYQALTGYRTGDVWIPKLDGSEALQNEARHFLTCIKDGSAPLTDAASGVRVVRVLEAASLSMRNGGKPVEIGDRK